MRIRSLHGYFILDEAFAGEISQFMSKFFGFNIVAKDDYFTFKTLAAAPTYALAGGKYMGALATDTVEGKPWEVMRANKLVYNFLIDQVVPIGTIVRTFNLDQAGNYFLSNGLILPGSLDGQGKRVTDFVGYHILETGRFKYSEVLFE